jgi:hypothetical protein
VGVVGRQRGVLERLLLKVVAWPLVFLNGFVESREASRAWQLLRQITRYL